MRRLLLCRNQEVRRKTDNGESPPFFFTQLADSMGASDLPLSEEETGEISNVADWEKSRTDPEACLADQEAHLSGSLLKTMYNGHDRAWPSRGYGNDAFSGQHWAVVTTALPSRFGFCVLTWVG